jgi:uncharacterized membrane protein YgcG
MCRLHLVKVMSLPILLMLINIYAIGIGNSSANEHIDATWIPPNPYIYPARCLPSKYSETSSDRILPAAVSSSICDQHSWIQSIDRLHEIQGRLNSMASYAQGSVLLLDRITPVSPEEVHQYDAWIEESQVHLIENYSKIVYDAWLLDSFPRAFLIVTSIHDRLSYIRIHESLERILSQEDLSTIIHHMHKIFKESHDYGLGILTAVIELDMTMRKYSQTLALAGGSEDESLSVLVNHHNPKSDDDDDDHYVPGRKLLLRLLASSKRTGRFIARHQTKVAAMLVLSYVLFRSVHLSRNQSPYIDDDTIDEEDYEGEENISDHDNRRRQRRRKRRSWFNGITFTVDARDIYEIAKFFFEVPSSSAQVLGNPPTTGIPTSSISDKPSDANESNTTKTSSSGGSWKIAITKTIQEIMVAKDQQRYGARDKISGSMGASYRPSYSSSSSNSRKRSSDSSSGAGGSW